MPTATGLRISSVNGTAFLDNCPADILAAVGTGAQIKIYDSSSRYLQGVIDVAGSSEGLGNELFTSWTNGVVYPYETFTSSGVDITSAINTGSRGIGLSNIFSGVAKALYKYTTTLTLNSGTAPSILCKTSAGERGVNGQMYEVLSAGLNTIYKTEPVAPLDLIFFNDYTNGNFSSAGNSYKQVTAPSSSGVIIKDLSGNQNFISKDASFTYNAASYTYEIIYPTSGTLTGLRISSVNGTAFLDNCPADVLAAADTGAILNIYDASNRLLSGVIGAVGSSEGLGSEIITSWTNGVTFPYETFTSSGVDITSAINTEARGIGLSNIFSGVAKALYKYTTTLTLNSGTAPYILCKTSAGERGVNGQMYEVLSAGLNTIYKTEPVATIDVIFFNDYTNCNFSSAGNSYKQVTAPSSSGVIIKDLSGNQNFISKDASFTYNAASYTYEIIQGGGCLVGSSALVGGHILVGHGSLIN